MCLLDIALLVYALFGFSHDSILSDLGFLATPDTLILSPSYTNSWLLTCLCNL